MVDVDGNGDLVVVIEGERWLLNPAAVTYVTDPEIVPGRSDSDHTSEIPTGVTFQTMLSLFLLYRFTTVAILGFLAYNRRVERKV